MPYIIVYLTVFLREVFSFQSQVQPLKHKVEELVWFEEPERFEDRIYSEQLQAPQNLRMTPYDPLLEEMVWFDFEEYIDYHEPTHTNIDTQNKVVDELKKSKEGDSDPWQNEDEVFAKYFFSNKWK